MDEESLEAMLLDMAHMVNSRGDVFIIKPKHLIVPPAIYRRLMWRPPIRKARNIRGRKRALSRRPTPVLWKMMKGSV
jgi:hypothetical protein